MALGAVCSKCGFTNQPGFQFCTNCGSALTAAPPMAVPPAAAPGAPPAFGAPPMYGPPTAPMPFVYGPPPWEMERRKQIDRTKTGILLLLIGTLLGWIPIIGVIGGLLVLIGVILVILGRKAFGAAHSRNVIVSLVLFILGFVGAFSLGFWFALAILSLPPGSPAAVVAEAVRSAFNTLLVGTIIVTAISSIGSILFTYALQTQPGRILLFAGYGANLAISIATLAAI
ncbi:MAG: zinc ribbon domain-containing protein, partial [Methanobacteriota archaeon]